MALVNDSRLQPLHPLLPLPAEPQQALVERTTSDTHFSRVEKTHRSVTEGRRARRARLPPERSSPWSLKIVFVSLDGPAWWVGSSKSSMVSSTCCSSADRQAKTRLPLNCSFS